MHPPRALADTKCGKFNNSSSTSQRLLLRPGLTIQCHSPCPGRGFQSMSQAANPFSWDESAAYIKTPVLSLAISEESGEDIDVSVSDGATWSSL